MTNVAKGIYRFTDLKSGEVFEGTRDEYAKHLKIKERTLNSRIQRGCVTREKIGEIKIKQKKGFNVTLILKLNKSSRVHVKKRVNSLGLKIGS